MINVRSVRFRLLAAVNTAIALLLGASVVFDYHREIAERVTAKHVSLEEEAKTLLPAVIRMQAQGTESLQRFIDDVCSRMQETSSPGHHIVVRCGQMVLQAVAHNRASPEIFEAVKAASESSVHRAKHGNEELVVGTSQQADTVVYVSEYLSNIRRSARGQVLRQLSRIAFLLVVTAVVVNVVFLRMAVRPLRKLVDTVRRIGEGQLGARTESLGSEEFDYLAEAINSMSSSLAETERRRRFEMDKARSIQEQLLPGRVTAPGLEFAHLYRPAEEVAGDYYDVISLPSGACLMCIADVAGHGVPAALSAAMLKAYLQDAAELHSDPGEILKLLNYRLAVVSPTDNFATMCILHIDPNRKSFRYASAGHERGLLLHADGALRELPSTGLVLGVLEHAGWTTHTLEVGPGDRVLLVTDGITEAMSPEGQLFGHRRLAEAVAASGKLELHEAVEQISYLVVKHCAGRDQTDDVTLLAAEIGPAPAPARQG